MLALVSSMTTTVKGCGSFENCEIVTGLPLSRISKSSCVRSDTRRPLASTAVAYTGTVRTDDRKVGCESASREMELAATRRAATRRVITPRG